MEITIITCFLISTALNFLFMLWAASVALKSYTKLLAQIVDICAEEDKDKQFIRKWAEINRH